MAGIHRFGYSSARPVTPNTTLAPLGNAPGATVNVFLTGTGTHASLFTNAALSSPLGNPFVTDVNAFFQYYVDPSLGDVDEAYSGTGIVTPYTLPVVLDLDPRVSGTGGDVAALQAALTAEIATRTAEVLALQQIGIAYPLGGSITDGIQSGSRFPVQNPIQVVIDGDLFAGYVLTVTVVGLTSDATVSLTPVLANLTTVADAGTGTPITSTTAVRQTFTATIASGVNTYALFGVPNGSTAFQSLNGYLTLAAA